MLVATTEMLPTTQNINNSYTSNVLTKNYIKFHNFLQHETLKYFSLYFIYFRSHINKVFAKKMDHGIRSRGHDYKY